MAVAGGHPVECGIWAGEGEAKVLTLTARQVAQDPEGRHLPLPVPLLTAGGGSGPSQVPLQSDVFLWGQPVLLEPSDH